MTIGDKGIAWTSTETWIQSALERYTDRLRSIGESERGSGALTVRFSAPPADSHEMYSWMAAKVAASEASSHGRCHVLTRTHSDIECLLWSAQPTDSYRFYYRHVLPIVFALAPMMRGIVLHAACVVDGTAGPWLFLGDRHAGKSTTTAILASAGCAIVSDDTVFIDRGLACDVSIRNLTPDLHVPRDVAASLALVENAEHRAEYMPNTDRIPISFQELQRSMSHCHIQGSLQVFVLRPTRYDRFEIRPITGSPERMKHLDASWQRDLSLTRATEQRDVSLQYLELAARLRMYEVTAIPHFRQRDSAVGLIAGLRDTAAALAGRV